MPIVTDQMDRTIEVAESPKRIISLVPSQTELLADLGLNDEVVAITKFCVHPKKWFRSKTRVGGTKKLELEQIADLNPDLIIGNKEENEQQQIEWLMQRFPVWMSDISTLHHAQDMIVQVGALVNKAQAAQDMATAIETELAQLNKLEPQSAAYFIWRQPNMVAGTGTFVDTMLSQIGLTNAFPSSGRYPEVTDKQLRRAKPDLILLSSEPYPFKHRHIEEYQEICPSARIVLVDGEMFSWYGSRLLLFPEYFKSLSPKLVPFTV